MTMEPRRTTRRLRTALMVLVVMFLIATGVFLVTFFVPGAIVTALGAGAAWAIMAAVATREQRGRRQAPAPAPPSVTAEGGGEPEPPVAPVQPHSLRTVLIIVGTVAALALILATLLAGWRMAGLAALAFFAAMIFMGAPVWLAATEESAERSRVEHDDAPASIR